MDCLHCFTILSISDLCARPPDLRLTLGDNYFNALRRLDFRILERKMNKEEFREFLSTHLVAATREVRPDIVRLLFQQVKKIKQAL